MRAPGSTSRRPTPRPAIARRPRGAAPARPRSSAAERARAPARFWDTLERGGTPMRRALVSLFAAASLAALPAVAHAQASDADKATARMLGQEGQDALDKKDFAAAEDRFKRADALFHAPTLLLGLARAYAGQGKFLAA